MINCIVNRTLWSPIFLTGINNTIEDRPRSLNMPLQIRRGTTAERITIRPVVGELIYDTDIKSVYVGDSTDGGVTGTLGGVGITVFGVEQAQDAAAAALAAGTHSGISFTYDDVLNKIDAVVGGGTVNLDIKGSVFSDDTSVILIDGVLAAINLDQTIKSNVIPAVDITYDLGSASKRFKDLYLSGSSINLGNATITATGAAVNLPAGSTVGGITIGSGDGVVNGSNYNINIIGDDSSIIVDSSTGAFTGDLTGSVFAADSSVIVDSVDATVYATTIGVHYGNVFGNVTGNILGNILSTGTSTFTTADINGGDIDGTLIGATSAASVRGTTITATTGFSGDITSSGSSSFATVDINGGTIDGTIIGATTTSTVRGTTITATTGFSGNLTGNVTGTLIGDVKGSIFADDSTLLVDGVSNILSNGITTISANSITSLTNEIIIGSPTAATGTTLTFNQPDVEPSLNIKNVAGALNAVSKINFIGYKTSLTSPGTPTAGELVGAFSFNAYNPAISNKIPLGLMSARIDPLGSYNASFADGKLEFITASIVGGGTLRYLTFDSLGQMAVNQQTALATLDVAGTIRTSGYTVATLPAGVIGMLAYVTDALSPTYLGTLTGGGAVKVPVFHNGTAWVSH